MGKYTDDEIRAMKKVTVKIAADYLGISHTMVTLGMRNNLLPIGFATKDESTYGGHGWTYVIVPERLIAYNHGEYFGLRRTPLGKFGFSVMKAKTKKRIAGEKRQQARKKNNRRKNRK